MEFHSYHFFQSLSSTAINLTTTNSCLIILTVTISIATIFITDKNRSVIVITNISSV